MPLIPLGDAALHVHSAGTGPRTILMLHAFPLHGGMWAPQLRALAGDFRLLAPDYRGMGRSGPAPDANTMALLAGDLLTGLRALGVRQAAVVGVSMGGYLALELVRRAPDLVRGLMLCDTKAVPDTVEQAAGREAYAASALAKGVGWVADDFGPKLLRPRPDPEVAARVRAIIRESTKEGVAACQRGMARRPDSVPTLARVTCPTLAVVGAEDQVTPFGELMRIAQTVPGGRLLRIPGAGHLPNLEAPAAFDAALAGFVASLY